jgi:predicted 2-oxoglutarate/Fe(II)-dependent dioxygenase YbiX
LVYINDNYEGGHINFPNQNFGFKPKAGDLIIFPGNNAYQHEVTEVISGKRYTMPSWYSFDIKDVSIKTEKEGLEGLLTNSKQLWDNDAGKVDL